MTYQNSATFDCTHKYDVDQCLFFGNCVIVVSLILNELLRSMICQEQLVHQLLIATTTIETVGNLLHTNFPLHTFFKVNIGNSFKLSKTKSFITYCINGVLTSSFERKAIQFISTHNQITFSLSLFTVKTSGNSYCCFYQELIFKDC